MRFHCVKYTRIRGFSNPYFLVEGQKIQVRENSYPCTSYPFFTFFLSVFLSITFTFRRTAGKRGMPLLTPFYYCYPLHRHLNIIRVITAESSPLHIATDWIWSGNPWLPSASRQPLTANKIKLNFY